MSGSSVNATLNDRDSTRWRCPGCGSPDVSALPTLLRCAGCETRYPVWRSGSVRLPFLAPDPGAALTQWWARYNGFATTQQRLIARLQQGLQRRDLSSARRNAIEAEIAARQAHQRDITDLLRPLRDSPGWPTDAKSGATIAAQTLAALPATQGLDGYLVNAHRDWSWNGTENAAQLAAIQEVVTPAQLGHQVLVAGSGTGRLGLDLFRWHRPDRQLMLDLNPLLSLIASRAVHGEPLALYEFPNSGAPFRVEPRLRRRRSEGPQRRSCTSPYPRENLAGLEFVCGDIMAAPFQAAAFTSVVTPWLIDILPHDMASVLPRLNELLPVGGHWINSGSWVPASSKPEQRYSEAELMDLCLDHGFQLEASSHKRLPYLQRPNGAQRRTERVWSFCLRKIKDGVRPPELSYQPRWATVADTPIEPPPALPFVASQRLLEAQVLAAINGQRSLNEIAAWVATRYELPVEAALTAVRQIVLDAQVDC